MGTLVGLWLAAGGQVEAPGLYATVPVAPGEGHVIDRCLASPCTCPVTIARRLHGAGAHKVGPVVDAVPAADRGLGRNAAQGGNALGVGDGAGNFLAPAIRHPNLRVGHRRTLVQRGDPGQCVLTAQLEVHAQVGNEGCCSHEHRAVLSMAIVEQAGPQLLRGNFQHMKACSQWNADDFKRARVTTSGLRKIERLDPVLALEERHHAGLHLAAVVLLHGLGQRSLYVALGNAARNGEVVIALHLEVPGDDVGIGGRLQCADLAGRRVLHVAQCDRQQRHAVGLGKALDHAKRRGGKLCQWGHGTGGDLQRKTVRIAQTAPGCVLETLGQLQREIGLLGEQAREGHAVDHVVGIHGRIAALFCDGLERVLAGSQPDVGQHSGWHRRVKGQSHGADGQTGTLRVLALATETGGKRLPYLVAESLFHGVGHTTGVGAAGRGAHTLAEHQLYFGGGAQGTVARQGLNAQRFPVSCCFQPLRLEQRGARGAVDQTHRHALAQAIDRAPDIGLHTRQRGRSVQAQREELLFVYAVAGVGLDGLHKRPARVELVADGAGQIRTLGRFEARAHLQAAAYAGGQIVLELKGPTAVRHPATRPLGHLGIAATQSERRFGLGVTKIDGTVVKLDQNLANLGHLALGRDADHLECVCLDGRSRQQRRAGLENGVVVAHKCSPL